MKRTQVGFTLVEMLFVVIIAGVVLAFALPGYRNMKRTALEKGATGYLMDLANARDAFVRDLNAQGIDDPWKDEANPWDKLECNIEVTPLTTLTSDEAKEQTLAEYIQQMRDDGKSETMISHALFAFNYLQNNVGAPGGYKYYLYLGFPILSKCGMLPPDKEKKMLAYMCKDPIKESNIHSSIPTSPSLDSRCYIPQSWAYLSDGSILPRSKDAKPNVLGTNVCEEFCDSADPSDNENPSCYDGLGDGHAGSLGNGQKLAHYSCQRVPGSRSFEVTGPVSHYKYEVQVCASKISPEVPAEPFPGGTPTLGGAKVVGATTPFTPGKPIDICLGAKFEYRTTDDLAIGDTLVVNTDMVKVRKKEEVLTWNPHDAGINCEVAFDVAAKGGTLPTPGDEWLNAVSIAKSTNFTVESSPDPYDVDLDKGSTGHDNLSFDDRCYKALPIGDQHVCTLWCVDLDVTRYNNNVSDNLDGPNNSITWTDGTQQSCYNYWHYGASMAGAYNAKDAADAQKCHAGLGS